MKIWIVKCENESVIKNLKEMGMIKYIPKLYKETKTVFIETNLSKEELLKIDGIVSTRENDVGRLLIKT